MSEQARIRREMCEYIEHLLIRPKMYIGINPDALECCWMEILTMLDIIDNSQDNSFTVRWQNLRHKKKKEKKLSIVTGLSDGFTFEEIVEICKDFYNKGIKCQDTI